MRIASNPEVHQSFPEETVFTSDVFFKDPAGSNGYQLYQVDDKPGSLTDVESSTGSSEKWPKPGVNGQAYPIKPTLNGSSSKNLAVYGENPIIPYIKNYNGDPFSEAISNGVQSSLSQETGSNGKILVHLGSEKSRDAEKAPSASFTTAGIINLLNNNGISPGVFPEFPFNFPVSKTDDTPIFETEDTKIPHFQQDGEKSLKERTSTHAGFVKPEALSGGDAISSPNSPWKSNFPNLDMPLDSLLKTNSADLHELLCQAVKTPVFVDMNSNKSLTEFLLILENWGRRGIDKVFNMLTADVESYFREDLQHGLDLLKQMSTRICTLMTAANNLPNLNNRDRNRIRGDFISTGIKLWLLVNELELSVIQAINNMATNPDIITNLFNKMIGKLSLLSKEAEDFQDKIREFCSEIEKFL